jgi:hypothetical protein
MREARTLRERYLANRIDQKAREIIGSRQKWRPGMIEFSHPYTHLTAEEEDFIARRIARWEFEIIGLNGRES